MFFIKLLIIHNTCCFTLAFLIYSDFGLFFICFCALSLWTLRTKTILLNSNMKQIWGPDVKKNNNKKTCINRSINFLSWDTTCRTLKPEWICLGSMWQLFVPGRSVRVWDGVGMAATLNPKSFGGRNLPPTTGANEFISEFITIVMVGAFSPLRGPIYCLQLILWNKGIELATLQPEQFSSHCTCVHI